MVSDKITSLVGVFRFFPVLKFWHIPFCIMACCVVQLQTHFYDVPRAIWIISMIIDVKYLELSQQKFFVDADPRALYLSE
jgi:hypothetical protein